MAPPVFLTLAEAIEVHCDQIQRYGGQAGVRSMELLESALAQPEASYSGEWLHRDLYEMAAAYAFHISQNHPFRDGNKRTALACALTFLELTALSLADPKGKLKDAMLQLASGRMDKQAFATLLREFPTVSKRK